MFLRKEIEEDPSQRSPFQESAVQRASEQPIWLRPGCSWEESLATYKVGISASVRFSWIMVQPKSYWVKDFQCPFTCAGSNHWSTTVTGVLFQVCIIVIGHSQIAYIHVLLLMPIDHKGRLLLFHSWCLWNDPEMMAALGDDDIKKSLYLISSKIESYCDPDCYHDVGCKKLLGGWGEASPWPSQRKGSDYAGIGWI